MHSIYGKIAAIDVHKKVLYVVVEGSPVIRARFGTAASELQSLREWLVERSIQTVVMEATALYWRPVWIVLELRFRLLLAQARSNAAVVGRKTDYADAQRLLRRLLADDLKLSFVPDSAQRDWRMLTRTRVEYGRDIVRWRNRLEGLLEEGGIKISSLLSNLLGVSGRRMLRALIAGVQDSEVVADLGVGRLSASREELTDALRGQLRACQRLLLEQHLDQIEQRERQIARIDQELDRALVEHHETIARMCEIPGVGPVAAQQILAEIGPAAASFPSPEQLASWVGVCPGREESAGVSRSDASPKGNRWMRRILNQCAWAALRTKGSHFEALFRRWVPRLGIQKAAWAVAHRILRVIWKVVHQRQTYRELGELALNPAAVQRRFRRVAKQMASLGFSVQLTPPTGPAEVL